MKPKPVVFEIVKQPRVSSRKKPQGTITLFSTVLKPQHEQRGHGYARIQAQARHLGRPQATTLGRRALAAVRAHAAVHNAPQERAAFTPARPALVYPADPSSSRKIHAPSVVMEQPIVGTRLGY
uniref:Uncharacterized protein n=1 Tax=Peronospora matthiolae TaxID=2874970 RepID=A0AAV1TQP3_9STRA